MKSGYFGIIPQPIRHHPELKPIIKLIYAEITACLESNGVCTKNNAYFSRVLDVSKSSISGGLTALRKLGFISVLIELEENTNKFIRRYISLPHTQEVGGGNHNSELPHTQEVGGVEQVSPLKDSATPTTTGDTLLLRNNIEKVYTSKKASTQVNPLITKEQKDYLANIVFQFYTIKRKQFPKLIDVDWKSDENLINGSINTLYDLIKGDDFGERVVRDVIKWATEDSFWRSTLLSLRSLRNKSSNGQTKFANLYLRYNK